MNASRHLLASTARRAHHLRGRRAASSIRLAETGSGKDSGDDDLHSPLSDHASLASHVTVRRNAAADRRGHRGERIIGFSGASWDLGWSRLFGGQVVAQALSAAQCTVDADRPVHSFQSYFIRPGSIQDVEYEVSVVRDGGSFSTRQVAALQNGSVIFTLTASFHAHEDGFAHQKIDPIDAPDPIDCKTREEYVEEIAHLLPVSARKKFTSKGHILLRPTEPFRPFSRDAAEPAQQCWIKARDVADDIEHGPGVHARLLSYASDFFLLPTCLLPFGKSVWMPKEVQAASLSHAIHFHDPSFRMDGDYLLYRMTSPLAGSGRGLCHGQVIARDGTLVASVYQEGLVRRLSHK